MQRATEEVSMCVIIQTAPLHPAGLSFLLCKTSRLHTWSQNSSRLWHVINFIRLDADWVLPPAAVRNLQYNMVWKLRIRLCKSSSYEHMSKKCYCLTLLQILSADYVDIHFYSIHELIPKYCLKRLTGIVNKCLGKIPKILQSVCKLHFKKLITWKPNSHRFHFSSWLMLPPFFTMSPTRCRIWVHVIS